MASFHISEAVNIFLAKKQPKKAAGNVSGNAGNAESEPALPTQAPELLGGNEGNVGNAEKHSTDINFIEVLTRHNLNTDAIEKGLKRWQQPFDESDLEQIKTGELSPEQIDGYLQLWRDQNPEMYQQLIANDQKRLPENPVTIDPLGGLPLLREDRLFINARLHKLPAAMADEVMKDYRAVWIDAALQADNLASRDNAGRRAANTWLREFVSGYQEGRQ